MKLSAARIAELAGRPGVDRTATENFLGTLAGLSQNEALANLELDAVSYRLSTATGRAIQQGIMEATSEDVEQEQASGSNAEPQGLLGHAAADARPAKAEGLVR